MIHLWLQRRTRVLSLFILIFCSISFAETDQAIFEQSISAFRLHEFTRSRILLISILKKNPDNSLYWFNLGNCFYMESKFDLAERAFKKVVDLNGKLTPAAQLYWAKSLLVLGKLEQAKTKLEALLKTSIPANLKFQVEEDLKKIYSEIGSQGALKEQALSFYQAGAYQESIDAIHTLKDPSDPNIALLEGLAFAKLGRSKEAQTLFQTSAHTTENSDIANSSKSLLDLVTSRALLENPYWLFLDLAAGEDSNIFLDGKSIAPTSGTILNASMGFGARFFNSGFYSAKIGYLLNWDEDTQAAILRVVTHTLSLPISYSAGRSSISIGPFYQYQLWAQIPALSKLGTRIKINQNWNWIEGGIDSNFSSQNNINADYSYLSGSTEHFRFYCGLIGESVYGQLAYELGSDNIGDLIYSNGVVPLANHYSGPSLRVIWKSSMPWILNFGLSDINRTYETLSQPGPKARKDIELSGSIRASYIMTPKLSAYAIVEQLMTTSTLGPSDIADKNVNDTRALIGISWDVL